MIIKVKIDNRVYEVEVGDLSNRPVITLVDGKRVEVWPEQTLEEPGRSGNALPSPTPEDQAQTTLIFAPMPGTITSISVKEGETVHYGQELCVLEAMKMKNIIRSPREGILSAVHVSGGQSVLYRDKLFEFQD